MPDSEKQHETLPYLAYTTFFNKAKEMAGETGHLPEQIDASLLGKMSGSGQKQFLATLRFFGMINDNGITQNAYKDFISAGDDEARKKMIHEWLLNKYPDQIPLLKTGTPKQLKDSFGDRLQGSTLASAVRFLLAAARDTGIDVNPHHKVSSPRPQRANRSSTKRKKDVESESAEATESQQGTTSSFEMALLQKFPSFDPSWESEQQKQWFEAYQKLLSMNANDPKE